MLSLLKNHILFFVRTSLLVCSSLVLLTPSLAVAQTADNFVNWESPHVHPIDITPDMETLLAVNTADNRLEVFDIVDGVPVARISIPVGLDPVSVRARSNTEAWVINHISDSVSIVDLTAGVVIHTLQTEDEPADVIFAGSNERAFVTCSQDNSVLVFDTNDLVATPTRLSILGEDPRGLAVSLDGNTVYAAIFESGNASTIIRGGRPANVGAYGASRGVDDPDNNPYAREGLTANPPPNRGDEFFPPMNPDNGTPPQVGMIVKKDDTDRWMDDNNRDWTHMISGDEAEASARVAGWDLPDNDVAIIDADTLSINYQSGLMNMVMGISVHPTSGRVSVVGTEAHNEVRFEPNLRSHFITAQFADFPAGGGTDRQRNLNSHLNANVDTLSLAQRSNSVGNPRAIAWGPRGNAAWVVGTGSNNIQLIRANGARRGAAVEVGQGPTGIVFDQRSPYNFYVLNRFDATISAMNGSRTLDTVPFFDPTPDVIKQGRPMLYDTHAGSGLGQVSCASCHADAKADRLAWDLGNPAGDLLVRNGATFHPMKGPMRTTSLVGIVGAPSLHFRGDIDELSEFAATFVNLQGLEDQPSLAQMDELEAFLGTINTPPNPYRNLDNSLPNSLEIPGSDNRVGDPNAVNNCANCHVPELNSRDDVLRLNSGNMPGGTSGVQPAIAPSLRSMYEIFGLDYSDPDGSTAGFGFIPDGSNDLEAGATLLNNNSVAFMMALNGDLEGDTHAAVGKQVTWNDLRTNADETLLSDLQTLADDRAIGLIAKGRYLGQPAGFTFMPAFNIYVSDISTAVFSHSDLTENTSANTTLTFTAVPFGSEFRMGVDRDNDGQADISNNVITGTTGDDVLEGTDESETFIGNGGSDIFVPSGGDDIMIGNVGNYDQINAIGQASDFVFIQNVDDTVTMTNAATGTDTLTSIEGVWFIGEDRWYSIASLITSDGSTIEGTSVSDNLFGTNGDDRIVGNGGSDTFNLSPGNDVIIGNASEYDQIDTDGSASDYIVTLNSNGTITIASEQTDTDILTNIDGVWFRDEAEWYSLNALAQ